MLSSFSIGRKQNIFKDIFRSKYCHWFCLIYFLRYFLLIKFRLILLYFRVQYCSNSVEWCLIFILNPQFAKNTPPSLLLQGLLNYVAFFTIWLFKLLNELLTWRRCFFAFDMKENNARISITVRICNKSLAIVFWYKSVYHQSQNWILETRCIKFLTFCLLYSFYLSLGIFS